MNRTTFSLEIFGDHLPPVNFFDGESNRKQLAVMKKALGQAINSELTERQKQMVQEYYFQGATMTAIAEKYGISKSTVSRHLTRSRERLKGALKYGVYAIWDSP